MTEIDSSSENSLRSLITLSMRLTFRQKLNYDRESQLTVCLRFTFKLALFLYWKTLSLFFDNNDFPTIFRREIKLRNKVVSMYFV